MNHDPRFQQYVERRRAFWQSIEALRAEVDEVLERMANEPVRLEDIALLEGLRSERNFQVEKFHAEEEDLLSYLLGIRDNP